MRPVFRLLQAVSVAVVLMPAAAAPPLSDWPQWRGPGRDGVWSQVGVVDRFAGPDLPRKWAVPIGAGYCGPTLAADRVFVMDRLTEPDQLERVHCFDRSTGKSLWTFGYRAIYGGVGYPAGPRASVTIHDGRAYSLGAVGHLHCLDAVTGAVLWAHDCNREYEIRLPIWGISAAPLIEGDLVICHIGGANGACVVAFDRKTGKERWKALADRPSYSAPVAITQGQNRVIVVWTADRVVGLNPADGAVFWEVPFPARRVVVSIASPVIEDDRLFLASFYDGAMMIRLDRTTPKAERMWFRVGQSERSTDAIQPMFSTPLMVGGYVYGVDSYGELRCLDARTGDRVWESLAAVPRARWSNIHFVRNADRIWMFNERGELIISRLSPKGFEEISRTRLLKPTLAQLNERGGVCWSHPAFAYGHVFARNDEELVCADLMAAR